MTNDCGLNTKDLHVDSNWAGSIFFWIDALY